MEEESVFETLQKRRKSEFEESNLIQMGDTPFFAFGPPGGMDRLEAQITLESMVAIDELLGYPPYGVPIQVMLLDYIGYKIEREYHQRKGRLTHEEKSLANQYFAADYSKIKVIIEKYLGLTQNKNLRSDLSFWLQSKDIIIASTRAERDVQNAMKICKLPEGFSSLGIKYKKALEDLKKLQQKLYTTIGFPELYQNVSQLFQELRDKVIIEDYKSAITLRDRLNQIFSKAEERLRKKYYTAHTRPDTEEKPPLPPF